ncbi:MAG TPA: metallopeptidase TldD-related protein [Ktedonobacterales bacterium]|nr:metallopeptidase TldD-related protein [Ktedonobacterales bacterium]
MSAVYDPAASTITGVAPVSGATTLNTETLARALAATPGANAWEVEVLSDEQAQLYVIGDAVESRRTVVNRSSHATIFNLHAPHASGAEGQNGAQPASQAMGRAELSLLAEDAANPDRLTARLADGVTMASLTDNPPYTLPKPSEYAFPMPPLVDPVLQRDAAGALDRARVQLEVAVAAQPNVSLSSAEFFATRRERSFRNSQGVRGSYQETEVFLDLVLIASDRGNSAEMHAELKRRRLEDLQIAGTVAAYATFARHSLYATTPSTARGPVILSGEALANFFSPLAFSSGNPILTQTSAQAAYQHLSRFSVGDFITGDEPRGDRLNLSSDPLRPYGVRSYRFDADGLPATEVALIENGVLRRQWADARYAAYLGVTPTGQTGNLAVGRGSASLDALRALDGAPVYEIVSFSAFGPDPVTGDFTAEIRLGYQHDATGVRPIKGGSLTGNIFTALQDVRFSANAYTDGVYYGPAAARFGDLSVAGS